MRQRLGLTLRFHDLRHTCVTLLLDMGVPPHIVRQIAGHSDVPRLAGRTAEGARDAEQPARLTPLAYRSA
ncbi:tyrosine-type recombinase/integrase [Streptacidiphilus monticola]|uniref:Tyrosine-type recombinase/integrase n=1 Tax=Streptacidiphilus monticola TaxID=2161674 RepID=A0ABW1GE45_9ACTN